MSTRQALIIDVSKLVALFFFVLLLASSGCKDEKETIIQVPVEHSLFDPSIKPQVLYTYPANNGTGPFNIFYPPFDGCYWECYQCDYSRPPHFYLQFNKMMQSPTLSPSSVHCSGFDNTVLVTLFANNGYVPPTSNVFQFDIRDSVSIFQYAERKPYQVGKTYTITLDTSIEDVNGNHLMQPFSFSFMPEPAFRVLKSSPGNGDSVSVFNFPRLQFNSTIDSTVYASIHISPPVTGKWYIYSDSLSIVFFPTTGLAEDTSYSITIDQTAGDKYGHTLKEAFGLTFHTYSFRISSTSPSDGDTLQYLNNGITIMLTGPVDPASVYSAFTLTPYFSGEITGSSEYISIYSRDHDLQPSTNYHVAISTNLKSRDGSHLQNPYAFSFVTSEFKIRSTYPNNAEQYVSRLQNIIIEFSGRIDTSSVRAAFSIQPRAPGHILTEYYGTTRFVFSPDSIYAAGTKYRVIISNALRSIDGVHIARPDTISFTTVQ